MITAAAVIGLAAVAAPRWSTIPCPSGTFAQGCSYTAPRDMAVTLFFQFEPSSETKKASLLCTAGEMTLCSRSWGAAASGSAGDCYFFLGAGQTMECEGSGRDVNVIGAHGAPLAVDAIAKGVVAKSIDLVPSYSNGGATDEWIGASFTGSGRGGIACTLGAQLLPVCGWQVNGTAVLAASSGGSCGFLLPAGTTVKCRTFGAAPTVASAHALVLSDAFAPLPTTAPAAQSACPIHHKDDSATFCDCGYANGASTDAVVVATVSSADDGYNSFHCFVGEANVCAWGSNRDNQGDGGSCWFVLPAGMQYNCSMEWGAIAVGSSSVTLMQKSLFSGSIVTHLGGERESEGERPAAAHPAAPRAAGPIDVTLRVRFDAWRAHHAVAYATKAEHERRLQYFAAFLARFSHAADAMPNSLAALSAEEFETSYRGCAPRSGAATRRAATPSRAARSGSALLSDSEVRAAPVSADWRTMGAVTPVKNQGQCGSCWSFSTTGSMEGQWKIAGNALTPLSEQTLVSCDRDDDNLGCGGGFPYEAMEYVRLNGIDTEESYPYASGGGEFNQPPWSPPCARASGTLAPIEVTGHVLVAPDAYNTSVTHEAYLAAFVAKYGPVSINVDAMAQLWQPYVKGIVSGCCNVATDHAVLIVGYGTESGVDYWIIKNSWGTGWGENGFIRLKRGDNECGLLTQPVLPTVKGGAVPSPPGPAPPTPTPPTPTPPPPHPGWECPADSTGLNTSAFASCMWVNGTAPTEWMMPPVVMEYCNYISSGYFGYTFSSSFDPKVYACPPSATLGSNGGGDYFCTITSGSKGFVLPRGASAECKGVTSGTFGYHWPL